MVHMCPKSIQFRKRQKSYYKSAMLIVCQCINPLLKINPPTETEYTISKDLFQKYLYSSKITPHVFIQETNKIRDSDNEKFILYINEDTFFKVYLSYILEQKYCC